MVFIYITNFVILSAYIFQAPIAKAIVIPTHDILGGKLSTELDDSPPLILLDVDSVRSLGRHNFVSDLNLFQDSPWIKTMKRVPATASNLMSPEKNFMLDVGDLIMHKGVGGKAPLGPEGLVKTDSSGSQNRGFVGGKMRFSGK